MKKVTMQHIADHLGVSKFVVSKALSGKGGVNEVTKDRVIQAASQLGYFNQKNAYMKHGSLSRASAPAAGSSRQSVIVLMPNNRFQTRESLYWGKILEGIDRELESLGIGMMTISESRAEDLSHILNPEGILGLIGVGNIESSLLLEVHRLGIPMVLVDHEDALIPTDTVFANNADSVMRLCQYLIELGHEQLHFIGDISFSRSFRDRWLGYREAMEANGLVMPSKDDPMLQPANVELGEKYVSLVQQWAEERLREGTMPTAMICANDAIALHVVDALRHAGIDVPGRVSVTGFDNIDDAFRSSPMLTTIHVPKESMGQRAVRKLLERIDCPDQIREKILVSAELVLRSSTKELKR
ncbi:LacI family DNA-binding transcriptional regulator [Paenibacillus apis]|uniref:Alanine racemase n=1 Tax=Paenibacillus apis TaxID=1792174 RepID=A0A919XWU1_9BACL|nr:LacI family DNA-binding transcriptional regulator [Paenibacillus apis]GIO40517.1 alanine racemase [Paenibacillus apis]